MVAVRRALLAELSHVADEWQKVLPTLALQLLQVRQIHGGCPGITCCMPSGMVPCADKCTCLHGVQRGVTTFNSFAATWACVLLVCVNG